jgi:hypothetical protein
MITVKVYFENGKNKDSLITRINATFEGAKKYYLGRWFNVGDGNGGDRMMKCYMIEAL